jgi:hypothetical protein
MIVWGGYDGDYLDDGARYNPSTSSWIPLAAAGAASERYGHTAVWTGSEMIVWGGRYLGGTLGDGARYNPSTDSWTPVSCVNDPSARIFHVTVWTGSEMIVWGGYGGDYLNDGARLGEYYFVYLPFAADE